MNALVLGGADCVWQDLQRLEDMLGHRWNGIVIAVNDIGCHWPRSLHHWVSLHPNKFQEWKALRNQLVEGAPTTWSRPPVIKLETWSGPPRWDRDRSLIDKIVLRPWMGGSSGMFAVQVAKELNCSRAILCGIPMTSTGHFAETREQFPPVWGSAEYHWLAWKRYYREMDGWVRSMSGRTRDLLGEPTKEWIDGDQEYR